MIAVVAISLLSLFAGVLPETDVANTTSDVTALSSAAAAAIDTRHSSGVARREGSLPLKRNLLSLSPENDVGNTTADVTAALSSFISSSPSVAGDDNDLCLFPGVTCRRRRVTFLILPERNLTGDLPPSLSSLSSLRRLDLRDNSLRGRLPAALFLHAPSLRRLILAGNLFSGEIPSSLYLCRRLRLLDLSRNCLAGSLPPGLGSSLPRLELLDLSSNRLSGPIPPSLALLSDHLSIDLSFNNLSGPIPQAGSLPCRRPSTFAGNPSLCGPPLKIHCPPPPPPADSPPARPPPLRPARSAGITAAVIGGDIVAIVVVGLLFSWCYVKCCGRRRAAAGGGGLEGEGMGLEELMKGAAYVVGKEGVGMVYRVVLGEGEEVAVRRLGGGGRRRREFRAQATAVGNVHHPNIVRLRAFFLVS